MDTQWSFFYIVVRMGILKMVVEMMSRTLIIIIHK